MMLCCICHDEASYTFEGYSLCKEHYFKAQRIHNTDRVFSILTSIRYHEGLEKGKIKEYGIQSNL